MGMQNAGTSCPRLVEVQIWRQHFSEPDSLKVTDSKILNKPKTLELLLTPQNDKFLNLRQGALLYEQLSLHCAPREFQLTTISHINCYFFLKTLLGLNILVL